MITPKERVSSLYYLSNILLISFQQKESSQDSQSWQTTASRVLQYCSFFFPPEFPFMASNTCFCLPFRKVETVSLNLGTTDSCAESFFDGDWRLCCVLLNVWWHPWSLLSPSPSCQQHNHSSTTYFFGDIEQLFNIPYLMFLIFPVGMMMTIALT